MSSNSPHSVLGAVLILGTLSVGLCSLTSPTVCTGSDVECSLKESVRMNWPHHSLETIACAAEKEHGATVCIVTFDPGMSLEPTRVQIGGTETHGESVERQSTFPTAFTVKNEYHSFKRCTEMTVKTHFDGKTMNSDEASRAMVADIEQAWERAKNVQGEKYTRAEKNLQNQTSFKKTSTPKDCSMVGSKGMQPYGNIS